MIKNVSVIGAGNLSTHLCKALVGAGFKIVDIYSRDIDNARKLAIKYNAHYINDITNVSGHSDIYIWALSDSAIEPLLARFPFANKLHIHTAGSIAVDIFQPFTRQYGVMYPLQSFSKDRDIDFASVPLYIEASNAETLELIRDLAQCLSHSVIEADSQQRLYLHLAAVFANNFSNHMFAIASQILKDNGLEFKHLIPLITETVQKLNYLSPAQAQTGPAVRANQSVMDKHLQMLEKNPDWQKIYTFVSQSIGQYQQKQEMNK